MKYKESDLYLPLKNFFEQKGFTVRSEVKNCDIVAIKGDEIIITELKLNFNISLVFQGMERQKISQQVYLAVPRLKGRVGYRNMQKMKKLCERLGLGLIIVALDSPLKTFDILVNPNFHEKIISTKKNIVVKEHKGRTFDLNQGGMNKRMISTAFRENVIYLSCILLLEREIKATTLMKKYSLEKNPYSVFYTNVYGWFEKGEEKGSFRLSKQGFFELSNEENKILVEHFKNKLKKL